MARLHLWLDECSTTHPKCSQHRMVKNINECPVRLLDLSPTQGDGDVRLKLIETRPGVSYEYACLSHRWDDDVDGHKTTSENLSRSLDFISLDGLSVNFRDAISIARNLGI